ncbi:hypothetical protein RT99_05400 [Flavobacterium sp. MEB061]|uniref:hypothetical protein n=1 Tax=Flavobacterium sp. MEB061 TaxID=1587524 RepID=UPI0005AC31CF|nr:hypothetical protein [Flavobacterium sp. MEB061]KIQ22945.1 hypothetical protein RT99_05400 [Flavobacterium sp. MEB061]
MEKRSKLEYIKLEDLKLDINNPRFAELYKGSTEEEDLIFYLLNEEAAEEIAKAIARKNEFYEDKALWVIKDIDGRYSVRDGNRRCAAVKALQLPGKYLLAGNKMIIKELPVYIYENEDELKSRISEEHAASLFRSWERIAKALQILDLADNGKNEEMSSLDSKPGDFIKLGSFYKEAVTHGDEEFRKQIRRGRGKTGGKTIIYERLFRDSKLCGYKFKNSPSFKIEIIDNNTFKSYIIALVKYIKENPDVKTSDIDKDKLFIKKLKDYGFDAYAKPMLSNQSSVVYPSEESSNNSSQVPTAVQALNVQSSNAITSDTSMDNSVTPISNSAIPSSNVVPIVSSKRGTVKKYPDIKRKQLPPGLKDRIDEYFKNLDSITAPNAKIAMGRVLFECIMKFVIEETKYNGRTLMSKSNYFNTVYSDTKFTDFRKMKHKFIDLITSTKDRNAILSFDLDHLHQVVHNYKVNGISTVGDQVSSNLIELVEFMLKDEADLLLSLDLTKL